MDSSQNISTTNYFAEKRQMTLFYQRIMCYPLIVIQNIGLIGNCLAFSVFMRQRFQTVSFAFYYKVMAITDTLVLIRSFDYWFASLLRFIMPNISDIFCKLTEYINFVMSTTSVLILSLIAFDRMLTIVFAQRSLSQMLRKRRVQICLVTLVLFFSIGIYIKIPITNYLEVQYFFDENYTIVARKQQCQYDMYGTVRFVNVAVFFVETIPIILVSNTFTVITIVFVFKSRARFRPTSSANNNLSLNQTMILAAARDRKFAINSIALNLISLLLKSPYLLFLNLSAFLYLNEIPFQYYLIFEYVGILLFNLDNASSFYVNMVVNSMFYDEFLIMVKFRESTPSLNRSRY